MWQCHYSLFINSHVRARFPADNNVSTIAQILIKYECAPGSALLGEPSWLAGSIDPRGPRGVRLIYGSLIESFAGWEKQVGTCERSWRGQNRYGNWLARTNYSLCPMFSLFFISLFVLYHFFLSSRPPARQAFIGCSSAFNWISDKEWRAEQPHNDCHVFRFVFQWLCTILSTRKSHWRWSLNTWRRTWSSTWTIAEAFSAWITSKSVLSRPPNDKTFFLTILLSLFLPFIDLPVPASQRIILLSSAAYSPPRSQTAKFAHQRQGRTQGPPFFHSLFFCVLDRRQARRFYFAGCGVVLVWNNSAAKCREYFISIVWKKREKNWLFLPRHVPHRPTNWIALLFSGF